MSTLSTFGLPSFLPIPDEFGKAAYQMFQTGKSGLFLAHKNLSGRLGDLIAPERSKHVQPLSQEILDQFNQDRLALLDEDWQDAQDGIYPVSLLFDDSLQDFFRYYPVLWFDLIKTCEMVRDRQFQSFSPEIDKEGYPTYYLQNFHYQVDGYLSEMSANLYDIQVEILFNGVADAMRRRILKPLKQYLGTMTDVAPRQLRVLDVACGTGRTLKMLRETLPKVSLFGTDLSPTYLSKANQLLSQIPGELPQLLQANAETLPYIDNCFHGITCVYLFHELPGAVRQTVIDECFRVTKPGGVFIISDSVQKLDSPELEIMMENFPAMFHEPYYRHYTTDDLILRLQNAGFENIQVTKRLVSKYWIAYKPSEH